MSRGVMLAIVMSMISVVAAAQRASVSIDLLKLAMATPNIGVDILLSPHFTFGVDAAANPFDEIYPNITTKQISLSPELCYWFKRPEYSHFVGVNILGSIYDFRLGDAQASGRLLALGVVYGYSFYLSERLSLTPSLGYGYGKFIKSSVADESQSSRSYFGPTATKASLSLTYIID